MPNPEGVVFGNYKACFDDASDGCGRGTDFMIVVGEPMEVQVWEADTDCTKRFNATTGPTYQYGVGVCAVMSGSVRADMC